MKRAVFLDLDGTIFRRESQLHFLLWCLRKGYAPKVPALSLLKDYLLYQAGLTADARTLREKGFKMFAGLLVADVEQHVQNFLCDFRKEIRREILLLLEQHNKQGDRIVLMTSAMDVLTAQAAKLLNISEVIVTRLLVVEGTFTGDFVKPVPWGYGKRMLAERYCREAGINETRCFCYCDHLSDLPLMTFVGHPVAVCPGRKLAQIARSRHWGNCWLRGFDKRISLVC